MTFLDPIRETSTWEKEFWLSHARKFRSHNNLVPVAT
jgi:hypothetical protein